MSTEVQTMAPMTNKILKWLTDLDPAVPEGEPDEHRDERHDEAGEPEHNGTLYPVQRQDTRGPVNARLTTLRALHALETLRVLVTQPLQNQRNKLQREHVCMKVQKLKWIGEVYWLVDLIWIFFGLSCCLLTFESKRTG